MEAWHLAAVQQHATHLHRLLDSVVTDSSVVVFDGLDDSGDLLWYLQLGQLDQLPQRLVTLQRNRLKGRLRAPERSVIMNKNVIC